jgi:hypothetical protein
MRRCDASRGLFADESLGVVEVESGIGEMIVRAESEAQPKPLRAADDPLPRKRAAHLTRTEPYWSAAQGTKSPVVF